MLKRGFFLFTILFISYSLQAQYFQTGEDPASIKWRQIHTNNFQLIYPQEFENQAQKMAYTLEKVYEYGAQTMDVLPNKISVLLHTHTIYSNGLVAIAPKRMELYTTPHQEIYPKDWLEQLAVHEFRHVAQVNKVEQNMPELLKLIFGEQVTALAIGAYLPFWFLEGDAVVSETALSNYGRGRLPSFLMEHKAQVVEKGVYSLSKAYNGSYKDFVPNHYKLGYFMVAASRKKYGSGFFEKMVENVGQKPLSINPVNSSLKKSIGMTQKGLYEMVFDSLKNAWQEEDQRVEVQYIRKNIQAKKYTNYAYNYYTNDGKIVTLKTAFDRIPTFIEIDSQGNEKNIHNPGYIYNESVSYTDNKIVWSEKVPNPRWSHSGHSVINILDYKTKQKHYLRPEHKGFSPHLSADKRKMVMVEADFQNQFYLSVYDVLSNKLISRFQAPENNYFFTPKWIDAQTVVAAMLTEKGKQLVLVNLENKELTQLIGEEYGEIKHPVFADNKVYFISSYAGRNDLYVVDIASKKVLQVYSSRFGVEYPVIADQKILLSNYTSDGFELIEIPLDSTKWQPIYKISKGEYPLAEAMSKQEYGKINFDYPDTFQYESSKYSKAKNILKVHSWAPASIDINSYEFQPGVSLLSQNILGTAQASAGYEWNTTDKEGKWYANYIFKGWYPEFEFEVSTKKRESQYYQIRNQVNGQNEIVRSDTTLEDYSFRETNFFMDMKIPLNLSKGKYNRVLQPEIQYDLTAIKQDKTSPDEFFNGNLQTLSYRFYYHQILRQSYQDLVPNFGFVIDASYRHSPFGDIDAGTISALQLIGYLPGAIRNHGISLYYGYQKRDASQRNLFSDAIRRPRGWRSLDNDEMITFSADYKLPLFYPDLSVGGIVYLKRVKASLFADFAHQQGLIFENNEAIGSFARNISSYGVEVLGDMNWFRFYAPVQLGFRTSYLPELRSTEFSLLLSVDFTSF